MKKRGHYSLSRPKQLDYAVSCCLQAAMGRKTAVFRDYLALCLVYWAKIHHNSNFGHCQKKGQMQKCTVSSFPSLKVLQREPSYITS